MLREPHRRRHPGLVLLGGVVLLAAGTGVLMLLWNVLLPPLLAVRTVTYWQALGLLVLARLLLGRGPRLGGWHAACCRSSRVAAEAAAGPDGAVTP